METKQTKRAWANPAPAHQAFFLRRRDAKRLADRHPGAVLYHDGGSWVVAYRTTAFCI